MLLHCRSGSVRCSVQRFVATFVQSWRATAFPAFPGSLCAKSKTVSLASLGALTRSLVHATECGPTLRSSGQPPAWHLAREALQVIIRLAGQAPHRRLPLSSNVEPHRKPQALFGALGIRSICRLQCRRMLSVSPLMVRLTLALRAAALRRAVSSSRRCAPLRPRAWPLEATACGARRRSCPFLVSVGVASSLPQWFSSVLCPALRCHVRPALARHGLRCLRRLAIVEVEDSHSCLAWRAHPIPRAHHRMRPNPSLERTATGVALGPRGASGHHPPRGPSATPASAAQLKR